MKKRFRDPVTVSDGVWFYEKERSIDLIVECRQNGLYHQTLTLHILKKTLEKLEYRRAER